MRLRIALLSREDCSSSVAVDAQCRCEVYGRGVGNKAELGEGAGKAWRARSERALPRAVSVPFEPCLRTDEAKRKRRMLLSILITLALVCGREGSGSDVQDKAEEEKISHAAAKEKNDTRTQRHERQSTIMRFLKTCLSLCWVHPAENFN